MQALWKSLCKHHCGSLGAWLATPHPFHRPRAERERESLTFRCFCPSRSIQACHAAGSMQPSMVLDRTMFHLYCSTTWLDQAQRKTPWTARVRVRQRQRERSVERKQHGEAQAEGSLRAALHSTHAKRCWIQEVILHATAGTPWSTIGVSEHEQSPGEFRDRADATEHHQRSAHRSSQGAWAAPTTH